jgi:hypothetical protein
MKDAGDGDDKDPLRHQLEITHIVTPIPKRKINTYGGNTQDPWGLEENVADMEVDEVNEVPAWATM